MSAIPDGFLTYRGDRRQAIVVRAGAGEADLARVLDPVADVDWEAHYHAYGPATDVPAQLAGAAIGDDATRQEAWWNLWGNILHQGTVYEATAAALPALAALAEWREYPDRTEALWMLRMAGAIGGVVVWRYGANGDIVHDTARGERLYARLRDHLTVLSARLVANWREEPDGVQRALVWLQTVILEPDHELVDAVLPDEHRAAFELSRPGDAHDDEEYELIDAFEAWVQGQV